MGKIRTAEKEFLMWFAPRPSTPNSIPNPDLPFHDHSPSKPHFRLLVKKHITSKMLVMTVEERVGPHQYEVRSYSYIPEIIHDSAAARCLLQWVMANPLDLNHHTLHCVERYMEPYLQGAIRWSLQLAATAYGAQVGRISGDGLYVAIPNPSNPSASTPIPVQGLGEQHTWLRVSDQELEKAKEVKTRWVEDNSPQTRW